MSSVKTGSGYPHALRSELHKALDAAGIQYWMAQGLTFWNCEDGRECVGYGFDASDGTPMLAVKVVGISEPEQAIAMTVGAGTCKRVYSPNPSRVMPHEYYRCSNCGYQASDQRWMYCPRCGHKYVHGEIEERWKTLPTNLPVQRHCPNCGGRIVKEEAE